MLKIMSFNVLCAGTNENAWQNRIERVAGLIGRHAPDTIGLQEAHEGWMDALTAALPEYDYVGVGRDDGERGGEFSPVFFRKDRFSVLNSGTFWLSETPDLPSKGWDAACRRVCTYAQLFDKQEQKAFFHYNTHLDHVGGTAQIEGAKLIVKAAAENASLPVLVTGDFNITPGSDVYQIMQSAGFFDIREAAPDTDQTYTFHNFNREQKIIDYIWSNNHVQAKRFKVITQVHEGRAPSDHYPVEAELILL